MYPSRKGQVILSLFTDDMILSIENPPNQLLISLDTIKSTRRECRKKALG